MGDFNVLEVGPDGMSKYHFNRFRVMFRKPKGETAESLARDFVSHFPRYFNNAYATVELSNHVSPSSKMVYKFHGYMKRCGVDLAWPHNDYVGVHDIRYHRGFTAQTLKRNFFEPAQDTVVIAAPGLMLPEPWGWIIGAVSVETNKRHFLAGRRSWTLTDASEIGPYAPDLAILETAAVERFSHPAFMVGDVLAGLEKLIPPIWSANLNNFVMKRAHGQRIPLVPHGKWKTCESVIYYQNNDYSDLNSLVSDPEYKLAAKLHPYLLPAI